MPATRSAGHDVFREVSEKRSFHFNAERFHRLRGGRSTKMGRAYRTANETSGKLGAAPDAVSAAAKRRF